MLFKCVAHIIVGDWCYIRGGGQHKDNKVLHGCGRLKILILGRHTFLTDPIAMSSTTFLKGQISKNEDSEKGGSQKRRLIYNSDFGI